MSSFIRHRRVSKSEPDCCPPFSDDEDTALVDFRSSKTRTDEDSDKDDNHPPMLRRAGSSTIDVESRDSIQYDCQSPFEDDSEEEFCCESQNTEIVASSSALHLVRQSIKSQYRCLTKDFCKSGMPWEGDSCRSLQAGGSGVLYALPMFFAHNQLDQFLWVLQAVLSVMADYFHIHHDSVWHGIDRCFATFNTAVTILRAGYGLDARTLLLAIPPVSCFIAANGAKDRLDLEAWHRWHFLWHLTGGIIASLVVYLVYNCPDNVDHSSLQLLCKH